MLGFAGWQAGKFWHCRRVWQALHKKHQKFRNPPYTLKTQKYCDLNIFIFFNKSIPFTEVSRLIDLVNMADGAKKNSAVKGLKQLKHNSTRVSKISHSYMYLAHYLTDFNNRSAFIEISWSFGFLYKNSYYEYLCEFFTSSNYLRNTSNYCKKRQQK